MFEGLLINVSLLQKRKHNGALERGGHRHRLKGLINDVSHYGGQELVTMEEGTDTDWRDLLMMLVTMEVRRGEHSFTSQLKELDPNHNTYFGPLLVAYVSLPQWLAWQWGTFKWLMVIKCWRYITLCMDAAWILVTSEKKITETLCQHLLLLIIIIQYQMIFFLEFHWEFHVLISASLSSNTSLSSLSEELWRPRLNEVETLWAFVTLLK